jgi:WD40 repeat protein
MAITASTLSTDNISASILSSSRTDIVISQDNKSKVISVSVPGPKGDPGTVVAGQSLNLSDLADINTTNVTDGSVLMWNTSTSNWVAKNDLTPETGDIILSGGNF